MSSDAHTRCQMVSVTKFMEVIHLSNPPSDKVGGDSKFVQTVFRNGLFDSARIAMLSDRDFRPTLLHSSARYAFCALYFATSLNRRE